MNAVAVALGVCPDLKQALQPSTLSTEPGVLPADLYRAGGQKIHAAVDRGEIETNLTLLRLHNANLQIRIATLDQEANNFRSYKKLNAYLGSTIQGAGTGMQLSKDLTVQHIGDIVGVVGSAASILFALCTAELPRATSVQTAAAMEFLDSFADNNRNLRIPDRVWRYMNAAGGPFLDDMQTAVLNVKALPSAAPSKGMLSGCRVHAHDTKLESISTSMASVEAKLGEMNQAMTRMLQQANAARPPRQ